MLEDTFRSVKEAARRLGSHSSEKINQILLALADRTVRDTELILDANQRDLDRMSPDDPKYDRLKLTPERILGIVHDLNNVATLPSPLGLSLEEKKLENGLHLRKISVPLGVVGIIYEARPNVTFDVFSLCLKSGNACILKGGSDAESSNRQIVGLIKEVLIENNADPDMIALLPVDRSATLELLHAVSYVDVIIPRGSQQLIDYVRDHSKVPVIETGAGVVHAYFDSSGDLKKGIDVLFNSKTRRVSVCNALDCLLIHENRLADLAELAAKLSEKQVQLFADEKAYATLQNKYPDTLLFPAQAAHFGTEFLDYKMSIKTVSGTEEALDHIYDHGSRHSEVIIAEETETIDHFLRSVDAAAVYANASTAFTDGAQFGMGAEIGISTQKLHARGPMALREMTSYKWLIKGNGTVRVP